jgi:hypothetical protein
MRSTLIAPIETAIQEIPWLDRYKGVVRNIEKITIDNERKSYMVGCSDTYDDCFRDDKLYFIAPDDNYNTLVAIEADSPINITDFKKREPTTLTTSIRLLFWCNLRKIGAEDCDTTDLLIGDVIKKITSISETNQDDISLYQITSLRVTRSDDNIFNKYDFHDRWRLFPYDYFTVDLTISAKIKNSCLAGLDNYPYLSENC